MKRIASLLLCAVVPIVSSEAADVAFVSFHPADDTPSAAAAAAGFTMAPDVGYTQLLEANGHNVTRYLTTGTPDAGFLNDFDLVIISRSVPSANYQNAAATAWNSISAPMMILGGYVLRQNRMGFFTASNIPDTADTVMLTATDSANPIFAGVSLDAGNTMVNPYAHIVSFNGTAQRGISVVTDPIAGGGTMIAGIAAPGTPTGGLIIGEWQAGASMSNGDTLAGRRLVFLTGSREVSGLTAEGAGIYDLDADGAQLFLNAVNYVAVPEPSTYALLGLGALAFVLRRKRA
jgi:hypothetical protein